MATMIKLCHDRTGCIGSGNLISAAYYLKANVLCLNVVGVSCLSKWWVIATVFFFKASKKINLFSDMGRPFD